MLTKVTYSMIQGASVNAQDYGAVGNGTTDDSSAIQAAINYVESIGGGIVVLPTATYKVNSTINHYKSVKVDLQSSVIDCTSNAGTYAWVVKPPVTSNGFAKYGMTFPEIMTGGIFIGVTTPADNTFNATLNCFDFQTSNYVLNNVCVEGFKRAINFDSNAFGVLFQNCSFSYNERAWYANQTGLTNMGAGLTATNTAFYHNNYDVYNNLCESLFINCSFDSTLKGVVEMNITSSAGTYNSQTRFECCRFENLGTTSPVAPAFGNNGSMIFKDCLFYGPLNNTFFFTNNDLLTFEGGLIRYTSNTVGSNFYLCDGTGTIQVKNVLTAEPYSLCSYLSPNSSNIFNSDFAIGTTDGWVVTTGSAGNLTLTGTAHKGSYALQMVSGGSAFVAETWSIPIPVPAKTATFNCYYTNANAGQVYLYLKFFTVNDVNISNYDQAIILNGGVGTYTLKTSTATIPQGAAYAKIVASLASGDTAAVRLDDLYINFI